MNVTFSTYLHHSKLRFNRCLREQSISMLRLNCHNLCATNPLGGNMFIERHEGKHQFLYCVKCFSIYTLSDFGVLSNWLVRYLGLFSNIYFLAAIQQYLLPSHWIMHDPEDRKKMAGLNSVFCTSFREDFWKYKKSLYWGFWR